jgi:hypothetical protein
MSRDPNLTRTPDYYAARAVEERRMAMASEEPAARAIHLEMAERYSKMSESGDGNEQPDSIEGLESAG